MGSVVNPHAGTEGEAGWAMGFSWGFVGPAFSASPPLVIAPEQIDAFNEGVLAGQQTAIEGLAFEPSCVSLAQEVSPVSEGVMEGVHVFEIIGMIKAARHLAHFTVEGLVFLFLLMIPGPPLLDAESEFLDISQKVRARLQELGLSRNSLFLAAGIDDSQEGCELKFTRLFTRLEDTRSAVRALGRPHWVIARWDADALQSTRGFSVIESDQD
jgi:hypothetical protein